MSKKVPSVIFRTLKKRTQPGDTPTVNWSDRNSAEMFAKTGSILFSLRGAFTPICSTYQLPLFDSLYSDFNALGIEKFFVYL